MKQWKQFDHQFDGGKLMVDREIEDEDVFSHKL